MLTRRRFAIGALSTGTWACSRSAVVRSRPPVGGSSTRSPARGRAGRSSRAIRRFWEFVAGPIHAGRSGPSALDPTFGPEVAFPWAPAAGQSNLPPWDGLQSSGRIDVTPEALTVALRGIDGRERYRVELPHA